MTAAKRRKKSSSFNLWSFLFQSKLACVLIGLESIAFWFVRRLVEGGHSIDALIISPSSLSQGHWWTLLSAGFIHLHWSHFALNMLGIFLFANIVEIHLGFRQGLLIFFGSLFLSMLFSITIYTFLMHQNIAIIGASGAVMGLLAAAMLLDPFAITYEMILPIPIMIKGWMFLFADLKGFLGQASDGVSHLAHLCGFLSVGFLIYFLSKKNRQLMHKGLLVNVVSFVLFIVIKTWISTKGFPWEG